MDLKSLRLQLWPSEVRLSSAWWEDKRPGISDDRDFSGPESPLRVNGIFHIVIINSIYQMNSFGNWIVVVLVYLPVIWLCVLNQSVTIIQMLSILYMTCYSRFPDTLINTTWLSFQILAWEAKGRLFSQAIQISIGKKLNILYLSHPILNENKPNQHGLIVVIIIWTRHVNVSRFAWKGMVINWLI